jgi:hypothetical protein
MFACKYSFTSYFFWNFKYAYLGDIKGGKSLNKLCYESNSPAEKEREVSSAKFRNILSLYLRSLWCKAWQYKKFWFFIQILFFVDLKIYIFIIIILCSCLSISIKDFVQEKKSATEKRKSNRNFYWNWTPNLLNLMRVGWRGRGGAGRPMQGMGTPT